MKLNFDIFQKFPILKTRRLVLQEITEAQGKAIFEMRSNGRVNQFIPREPLKTVAEANVLAQKAKEAFANKQGIGWAGVLRDKQEIIGTCGFNSIDFDNLRAEIGGEMDVKYWGKNIAQEAVEAIIHFGLHTLNLHTIEAKVSPNNRGAIYVLEQLGFKKEAHYVDRVYFNGKFDDMAVYTLIEGEENLSL